MIPKSVHSYKFTIEIILYRCSMEVMGWIPRHNKDVKIELTAFLRSAGKKER